MSTKKISALTALGAAPDAGDYFAIVDVSDTTDAATGTTKKVSKTNLLSGYLTSISGESIKNLSDVYSSMTPTTGQALVYDTTNGWQAETLDSGVGSRDFVASGAIGNGDTVIINADGTVSAVTGEVAGLGSDAEFNTATTDSLKACFDSVNNKVIIAYRDAGNSYYGTAVVGTVSGTSITFGTPVVFGSSSSIVYAAVFDSTNERVVISYADAGNSYYGTAAVGTVSGTSITFGTPVVFESAQIGSTSAVFDPDTGKVVIAYQDVGNSNYGTAIIGTVSGTSISFGTPVVFKSAHTQFISACFDSTNSKTVICYQSYATTQGEGIVGTVSGTSISFGSPVVFDSNAYDVNAAYDSANSKVVIAYRDVGNSNYGTSIIGTVSGTAISFGTAVVFDSSATFIYGAVFDSGANKFVVSYRVSTTQYGIAGTVSGTSITFDTTQSIGSLSATTYSNNVAYDSNENIMIMMRSAATTNYGTAKTWRHTSTSTANSENVLGFSQAAISDAATGSITTDGGISTNQSGLTSGQQYYVDDDGSLTTTANGRPIGRAISSTEILVQTL